MIQPYFLNFPDVLDSLYEAEETEEFATSNHIRRRSEAVAV